MRDRRDIITEALLIQVDNATIKVDMFTSKDILIAVGINEVDVECLREDFNSKIDEFLESIGV